MTVKFIKLDSEAIVPTYGTPYAAGADLYALPQCDIEIKSGETVLIHTGIAMQIPEGYGGFIFARSGIATKRHTSTTKESNLSAFRIRLNEVNHLDTCIEHLLSW